MPKQNQISTFRQSNHANRNDMLPRRFGWDYRHLDVKSDLKDPLNQTSIHQNHYCYINPQVIVMRRFPFTWSCSSCQSWEYESTPAERMKISWEEPNRTEPKCGCSGASGGERADPIRSESAGTSVTWNELNSTNEAVIALEQFPTVKQWQAPGTSAEERTQ